MLQLDILFELVIINFECSRTTNKKNRLDIIAKCLKVISCRVRAHNYLVSHCDLFLCGKIQVSIPSLNGGTHFKKSVKFLHWKNHVDQTAASHSKSVEFRFFWCVGARNPRLKNWEIWRLSTPLALGRPITLWVICLLV